MKNERKIGDVEYGLTVARGLISKPENWTKNVKRMRLYTGGPLAYCAIGALEEAAYTTGSSYSAMRRELTKQLSAFDDIVNFNDNRHVRHAEVLALYDRAIKKAQEQGI